MVSLSAEFPNDNPALHRGAIWVTTSTIGPAIAELPEPIEEVSIGAPIVALVDPFTPEPVAEIVVVEPTPIVLVGACEADDTPDDDPAVVSEPPPRPSGILAIGERDDLDFEIEAELALDEEEAIVVEELEPLDASMPIEEVVAVAESANDSPATALPPPPDDPFTLLLTTLSDVAIGADAPHVAAMLPPLLLEGALAHAPSPETAQALADGGIARGGEVTREFAATTLAWRDILRGTSDDFSACGAMMLDEWAADLLARLLGAPERTATLRRELRSRGVAAFGLANAA